MTQATLNKKVINLEVQIKEMARRMAIKPNFDVDELSWKRIEREAKKTRKQIFKRRYG